MTLTAPTTLGPPDFERDQWGRPLIVPADGGRPRPYTRASSAAKTVEDTFNLELWARRNVAFGMARDNSLVARVLALGGDPSTWDLAVKKQANQIVEDASGVALSHRAADIGTALHRLTEMLDRGDRVPAGPYEADLEAYVNALITAGLSVVEVECRLVCDELEMAGTADRILRNGGAPPTSPTSRPARRSTTAASAGRRSWRPTPTPSSTTPSRARGRRRRCSTRRPA